MEGRSFVVSLHDVSPLTRPIFEPMIAELRRWASGSVRCWSSRIITGAETC